MINLQPTGPRPHAEIEVASRRLTLETMDRDAGVCRITIERRGIAGPHRFVSVRVYLPDLRAMLDAIDAPASSAPPAADHFDHLAETTEAEVPDLERAAAAGRQLGKAMRAFGDAYREAMDR